MSKLNFEDLYFDVSKFGDKKPIIKVYPELLAYNEDVGNVHWKEWKVAILITDVGSPFVKIKDPKQKLDGIFEELKFDSEKTDSKIYNDFLNQNQSGVVDACSFLIEYFNNHKFAAWYELNKTYYELNRAISKKLDPLSDRYDKELDRKITLQGKADAMIDSLARYEVDLFGSASMKADAAYKSKKRRKMNWNEKYAVDNQVE